jgi:hypothetical protein
MLSCEPDYDRGNNKLFTLPDYDHTNIDFLNRLDYTESYNTYTYRNFYNGAGVGLGDLNSDGLPDIYFCGNLAGNRLYINKGNFVFEDVTEKAGVACKGAWSTGVTIADVNGDGREDIYVCKSGDPASANRRNELFINNGDMTFTEKAAEFGLSILGLSNHASFFDYDRDGDLDCYLLSNSVQSVSEFDMKPDQRMISDTLGGNRLFRNDDGIYTDVTSQAGIYGSKIGFGLGVSAGDVNRDGWTDIYVLNDFFERDYLYINTGKGTFRESLEEQIRETSLGAMGADIADINNDAWPEIFVTEMTPEGNARLKTKTLFESWERYQQKLENGYYHQFARNTLQLNNRDNTFSEIGRLSGVCATDWSWGALITDLDNDGWKDIFVANGIYKDLLDRDYLDIYSDPSVMRSMIRTEEKAIMELISRIPSVKVANYSFHNNGDLTFINLSDEWGLGTPSHSNGAAYGDLDNDGDMDLVINNVNMPPFICRNGSEKRDSSNFLMIKLKGSGKNTAAIGSSVTVYYNGRINYQELIPARGFMSSVDTRLHFGLGASLSIDSLNISWPDGRHSVLYDVRANQFLTIEQNEIIEKNVIEKPDEPEYVFSRVDRTNGLEYLHRENQFVDFDRDRLIFNMLSNEGPHIATGDINGDSRQDIFICGAKDSPGELFVQDTKGNYRKTNSSLFESDRISEDTDCAFFDADGDLDQDLYVATGGNEFPTSSSALADRLYFNDGRGNFSLSDQILPAGKYESTSCVEPADFDDDGDMDLFVGIRLLPFSYGLPVDGYLLENDGKGNFKNVTGAKAPGLRRTGMITDMEWADLDNDGDNDMIIAGDWMAVKVFLNNGGIFIEESARYGLEKTEGWWHRILAKDLNNDGYVDFVLGNNGLNSRVKAARDKPATMYVNDFDLNGSIEQMICTFNGDTSYPLAMKDDLVKEIPSLQSKYKRYIDYKDHTISDIFPGEVLKHSVVLNARVMESCILLNSGGQSFELIALPVEAQFSPAYAISAGDYDKDGNCDIILGGNQYRNKPEIGINDASYGLFLKGKGNGEFEPVPGRISGLMVNGEIRDISEIKISGNQILIFARNNDNLMFYKY